MLSLAMVLALFVAGIACLVRDGMVNEPRRAVRRVDGAQVDLERMFELPSRRPTRSGHA